MRKKCFILSICSFLIARAIFAFTFYLFHYAGVDGGFVREYQETMNKPFVTLLFGIWGVCFLFASVMSFVVGLIFFAKPKQKVK